MTPKQWRSLLYRRNRVAAVLVLGCFAYLSLWHRFFSYPMCGRYKPEEHWQEYCQAAYFNWRDPPLPTPNPLKGSKEVRPTDPMPIIRRNQIKRDVIKRDVQEAPLELHVEVIVQGARCLIPMSSWDEWPQIQGKASLAVCP